MPSVWFSGFAEGQLDFLRNGRLWRSPSAMPWATLTAL